MLESEGTSRFGCPGGILTQLPRWLLSRSAIGQGGDGFDARSGEEN
jgi:hypothetical protein